MKKIILFGLLAFSTLVNAKIEDYPHPEQFIQYNVKGTSFYILKDKITGCEYIYRAETGLELREGSCNKSTK